MENNINITDQIKKSAEGMFPSDSRTIKRFYVFLLILATALSSFPLISYLSN
ncbi:MAG: hypothetical protein WC140_06560 [Bacteroidales bacterium]